MKNKLYTLVIAVIFTGFAISSSAQVETRDSVDVSLESLHEELRDLREQQLADREETAYQTRQSNIWKKSAPWMFSIGNQSLEDVSYGVKFKSDFSFGISKRRTYYLHHKPIADMVKIGLDLSFFEITVSRYSKGKGVSLGLIGGNTTSGTYANYDDYFNEAYNNASDVDNDMSDMLNRIDIGKYHISYSMLGIGPNIKIAPFYTLNKEWADNIKATVYAHYVPTLTALIFTGNKDNSVCGGYVGCWRYGLNISFGRFGIGFEHQWGKGYLKKWKADDDEDEGEEGFSISSEKRKYNMSTTRFYIGFKF